MSTTISIKQTALTVAVFAYKHDVFMEYETPKEDVPVLFNGAKNPGVWLYRDKSAMLPEIKIWTGQDETPPGGEESRRGAPAPRTANSAATIQTLESEDILSDLISGCDAQVAPENTYIYWLKITVNEQDYVIPKPDTAMPLIIRVWKTVTYTVGEVDVIMSSAVPEEIVLNAHASHLFASCTIQRMGNDSGIIVDMFGNSKGSGDTVPYIHTGTPGYRYNKASVLMKVWEDRVSELQAYFSSAIATGRNLPSLPGGAEEGILSTGFADHRYIKMLIATYPSETSNPTYQELLGRLSITSDDVISEEVTVAGGTTTFSFIDPNNLTYARYYPHYSKQFTIERVSSGGGLLPTLGTGIGGWKLLIETQELRRLTLSPMVGGSQILPKYSTKKYMQNTSLIKPGGFAQPGMSLPKKLFMLLGKPGFSSAEGGRDPDLLVPFKVDVPAEQKIVFDDSGYFRVDAGTKIMFGGKGQRWGTHDGDFALTDPVLVDYSVPEALQDLDDDYSTTVLVRLKLGAVFQALKAAYSSENNASMSNEISIRIPITFQLSYSYGTEDALQPESFEESFVIYAGMSDVIDHENTKLAFNATKTELIVGTQFTLLTPIHADDDSLVGDNYENIAYGYGRDRIIETSSDSSFDRLVGTAVSPLQMNTVIKEKYEMKSGSIRLILDGLKHTLKGKVLSDIIVSEDNTAYEVPILDYAEVAHNGLVYDERFTYNTNLDQNAHAYTKVTYIQKEELAPLDPITGI